MLDLYSAAAIIVDSRSTACTCNVVIIYSMQRARHVRVACAQDKFKYCILNLGWRSITGIASHHDKIGQDTCAAIPFFKTDVTKEGLVFQIAIFL